MAFTALRTVLPPTCVEHSVRAHMTSAAHVNLVVARASVLQLYRLVEADEADSSASLVLVHEKQLFGRIESLVAFRPAGWPRDLLGVTVRDGKLSILQFDVTRHEFGVVSLHFFETGDVHGDDRLYVRAPLFRVDPTSACGVVRVYDRKLMVVPFRSEFAVADPLGPVDDFRALPASYALDLDKLGVRHVKDFCFLENYFQPALLLLHDTELTAPGRAAYRRNTSAVTVLTLDPKQRLAERLWSFDGLPFDTHHVVAAPKAIGGALLLALNTLIYVNDKVRLALPVETLSVVGPKLTSLPMSSRPVSALVVPSARFIARDTALISTDDGWLHALRLVIVSGTVKSLAVRRIGRMTPASTITALAPRLVFAGSRLGDSLLLHVREKSREEVLAEAEERRERARREQEAAEQAAQSAWAAAAAASTAAGGGDELDIGALGAEIALIDINDDFADPFALATQAALLFTDAPRNDDGSANDNDDDVDDKVQVEHANKRLRGEQTEPALDEFADEDNPYAVLADSSAQAVSVDDPLAAADADGDMVKDEFADDAAPVAPDEEIAPVAASAADAAAAEAEAEPHQEEAEVAVRPTPPADALFAAVQDDEAEVAAIAEVPFGMPLDVPLFRVTVCDMLVGTGPLVGLAVGRTGGVDESEAEAALRAQLARADANAVGEGDGLLDDDDGDDDKHGVAGPTLSATEIGEASVRVLPNEPKPGQPLKYAMPVLDAELSKLRAEEHAEHVELLGLKRHHEQQALEMRGVHKQRLDERRARYDEERRHARDRNEFERRVDADRRAAVERENAEVQAMRQRQDLELSVMQARHNAARALRKERLEAAQRRADDEARHTLLNDEQTSRAELDMVACAGRDRDGSLAVMHASVRPRTINTLQVPGCIAVWTLHVRDQRDEHALLVLSTGDRTRVLSTGEQLQEVTEQFEVRSDRATLDTFNLFSRAKIAQVHARGLRLLEGAQVVQDIDLDEADEVVGCSAADPYVALLLASGAVLLLTCRADVQMLSVTRVFDAPLASAPRGSPAALAQVTAVALYARHPALHEPGPLEPLTAAEKAASVADARASAPDAMALDAGAGEGAVGAKDAKEAVVGMTAEEEELALYGTLVSATSAASEPSVKSEPVRDEHMGEPTAEPDVKPRDATHFLFVTRASGLLEVFAVPSMQCVFAVPRFTRGPPLVRHDLRSAAVRSSDATTQEPRVQELLVTRMRDRTLARDDGTLYLMALTDSGDLLVYRVFRCVTEARADASVLPFRLARVEHGFVRRAVDTRDAGGAPVAATTPTAPASARVLQLRPMGYVSGIESVVVGGSRPVWLMQVRGALRAHQLFLGRQERGGAAFAAFHHRNCRHGFVYYEAHSEQLRLCRLPTDTFSYEPQLPMRKIPLHVTPHSVVYDRGSGLYVVAVSQKQQIRVIGVSAAAASTISAVQAKVDAVVDAATRAGDGDALAAAAAAAESEYEDIPLDFDEPGGVPLFDTKFELLLMNPRNWETMDRYVLEEAEHVLSMRVCRLKHNESRSLRAYVVVGTGHSHGEDEMSTGRILIFEILMPHMLLRSVSVRPEKAPISAVVDVCGHLVACAGLKVNSFDFSDGSTLSPCAFLDLEFFIVSADSIKNYVVLGDAVNSVHFFRWRDTRERGRHLIEISRDNNALRVTNTTFVVDEPNLALAAFDALGHLQMFEYAPHHGQRLVCRAEIGLGTFVPCTVRVRCNRTALPPALPRTIPNAAAKIEQSMTDSLMRERQCVFFGTRDGSLCVVAPLAETAFRRLRTVFENLQHSVPWTAGVTPASLRKSRLVKFSDPSTDRLRTLDGDALAQFAELEVSAQRELARRCGTTSRQVMNNLIEFAAETNIL